MYSIFDFKCNMSSIHSSCQSSVRNTSQPVPVKSESELGGGALLVSYLLIQVNCFHCWETQFLITLFIHFKFHVDTDLREYDTPICSAPQISRTSFGIALFANIPMSRSVHKYRMQFKENSEVPFWLKRSGFIFFKHNSYSWQIL